MLVIHSFTLSGGSVRCRLRRLQRPSGHCAATNARLRRVWLPCHQGASMLGLVGCALTTLGIREEMSGGDCPGPLHRE